MLESVLAQSDQGQSETCFWKSMTKQDLVNNMYISLLVVGVLKPGRWQGRSTGEMLLLWLTFGYQVRRRQRRCTWPCPSISQLVSNALDQWFWQTLGSKEVLMRTQCPLSWFGDSSLGAWVRWQWGEDKTVPQCKPSTHPGDNFICSQYFAVFAFYHMLSIYPSLNPFYLLDSPHNKLQTWVHFTPKPLAFMALTRV